MSEPYQIYFNQNQACEIQLKLVLVPQFPGTERMEANMETYTINEVAMMTGLTTRTLRNYIKMNVLKGEKIDGAWRFTVEDISDFISNPCVKPSIQTKNKAVVLDFLAVDNKRENEMCTVLDLYIEEEESQEVSAFFCDMINNCKGGKIRFNYERNGKNARIILSGCEDVVMEMLNAYYGR